MKVKRLIEVLSKMDEDAEVVRSGSDHSYITITRVNAVTAAKSRNEYREWYGEQNACIDEQPAPAVVLD